MDYAKPVPGIDVKFPRLLFYEPLFDLLAGVQNRFIEILQTKTSSVLLPITVIP